MGLFDGRERELETEVVDLRQKLEFARTVGRIADAVEVQLRQQKANGQPDDVAADMAMVTVVQQETEAETRRAADDLLATHRDDYVAIFRREKVPEIRAGLDKAYK